MSFNTNTQGYYKSDTTCLINPSLPFIVFLLIHLPLVFLLLLTVFRTFQHAQRDPVAEGVVILEHVTDIEASILQPRSEQKGEAPSLCVIGWAGKHEFLAVRC